MLMVFFLSANHVDPIAKDITLTAQDVGLSLWINSIKSIRNYGNENVQEDHVGHYDGDEEPYPEDNSELSIISNVEVIDFWLTKHC